MSIFCATIQLSGLRDTNSGPLSERRNFGAPRSLTSRDNTSIIRGERMRPSTSIARPSLVNASVTVRHFSCWPFAREGSIVEPQLRQVAVRTAVRERDANYVWAAQVDASRRIGLREAVIDLLRAKGDPASLSEDERDIVVYMRQLMRTNRVEQTVFDALRARHSVQWMVELTAIANFYVALCGVVNAFDVPIPPDGDRFA
jgi:alkylhydroperoxidase family enzyme